MSSRSLVVLDLAWADLRHEWILTLCLVLAIAAIIAPLLLLLGLKYGTIATLRDRLVQDPTVREIKPVLTREYDQDWFRRLGGRNEVGFLTPTILPASSIITVVHPRGRTTEFWDLVPTAPGDPLLLENGGAIPGPGEVVLTRVAAEKLAVGVGDRLEMRATRIRKGKREAGSAVLRVVAVLEPRAGALLRVYAPLQFVLDVEAYKEGLAIPSREWDGSVPRPYLSLDGVLLLLPKALSPIQESGLAINTGLSLVEGITAADFRRQTGLRLPDHWQATRVRTRSRALTYSSYRALKGKVRGKGAVLLPYVDIQEIGLSDGGQPVQQRVFGLSLSSARAKTLGLPPLPWGRLDEGKAGERWRRILLPVSSSVGTGRGKGILTASVDAGASSLEFPLRRVGSSAADYALVPAELLGALRTARGRKVNYDPDRGDFLLTSGGFRGFRLYARTIDDVAPLVRVLRQQGVEVIAQTESIERIRVLDRGLTRIFWLVAVVGIVGGIAALVASLYAAVERKKQALSVLRLLGLSRRDLFDFPVYQGVAIAILSLLTAGGGYFTLAAVINRVFSSDLALGQRICHLPADYLLWVALTTVAVAWLSSLFAAWRTTHIDPAEALRYE